MELNVKNLMLATTLTFAGAAGLAATTQTPKPDPKPAATKAGAAKSADKAEDEKPKLPWSADTWSGLALRGIGPAVTSGRVVDIAVDPTDKKRWFLAVASGGVWTTENAGTTWTPVFDGEGSYSIGCVTIDPQQPAASSGSAPARTTRQRSVGYGDGVYQSRPTAARPGRTWA